MASKHFLEACYAWGKVTFSSQKFWAESFGQKVILGHAEVASCGGAVQGCTPLHVAAHQGHAYAVSRLARAHGCEINAADEKGRTAMHHAAGLGHNAVVMELWARSNTASLEAVDHIGATGPFQNENSKMESLSQVFVSHVVIADSLS